MEEPSDKELVEHTLSDPEAYRHIINRYRQKLLRYTSHLGARDKATQEDILQEVFIKTYRNLNAYNDTFPFSSWIYRITHNETMSYFRRKKFQPLSLDAFSEPDALLKDIPEEHNEVISAEALSSAVNELDQKYKDVIVLKYFEEKSYDEIADILEKPPGTVATLLNRAKQKLRIILDKNHGR